MGTIDAPREGSYYQDGMNLYRVAYVTPNGTRLGLENCWTNKIDDVPLDELEGLTPVARDSNRELVAA